MNPLFYLILISIGLFFGYEIYRFSFDHVYHCGLSLISEDAKIIKIFSEIEPWGRSKYVKTVVRFSDGFEFHTYKCRREFAGLTSTRLVVDDEVRKKIIVAAFKAHDKLVFKYNRVTN